MGCEGPPQPHPEGLVSCLSLEDQGPVCEQEPGRAERKRTKRQMGGTDIGQNPETALQRQGGTSNGEENPC